MKEAGIAGEELKAGDMVTRRADGMWYKVRSRQDEIRNALIYKMKAVRVWTKSHEDPLSAEDDADDILNYLSSQGVVLKVEDKDIPDYISGCVKNAKQFGFTRTEPLLDNKKEG